MKYMKKSIGKLGKIASTYLIPLSFIIYGLKLAKSNSYRYVKNLNHDEIIEQNTRFFDFKDTGYFLISIGVIVYLCERFTEKRQNTEKAKGRE